MADEKKIIFQIEVDNSKSINQILSLKDRIKALKDEQKQLNLSTLEGRKANEAYNAQIKALTKEQKSLELAVEKTAASFEFEAGSIAHNRAELSKLTAEYKNLANPTKEQTEKIRQLTETLKAQEAAIGDNRRNVGNYKESLDAVIGSSGIFGSQLGQLQGQFLQVTGGLQTVSRGFGTLKGAIIGTGIGALIVLLGSLVAYFSTTDTGATKLAGVMGALGAVMKRITGVFAEIGKYLVSLADGSRSLGSAFSDLGDLIVTNFINRLKAPLVLLGAISDAFKEIAENGLDANLEPALKKTTDAFIQLGTGVENGTDKLNDLKTGLSELAAEMLKAAEEAYNYALAVDALDDAQRDLNVTNAKAEKQVALLLRQAQDRTKTDQERIALIQQANKIEEDAVTRQLSLDKQRLKLVEDRNKREADAINQRLNLQIAEAKSEQEKIELRKEALDISDELAQEEADLRVKIINQETSFISLREKNLNKIAVLEEKIAADGEKVRLAELARQKKLLEAQNSLDNQRVANQIKNIDLELQQVGISNKRRISLLQERAAKEIKLEKQLRDQKLANTELLETERKAIQEQFDQRRIEIEAATQKALTDVQLKAEADRKKQREESQKQLVDGINIAAKVANDIVNIALRANEEALTESLSQLDEQRKEELARAGNDKAKQQAVNRKFDKLAEKEKKAATKKALELQEIQAIANGITAVTQALASPAGPPTSFILASIAGGLAAVQLAQLEKAKSKLADGGLIEGPSHASGGVQGTGRFNNIEVEGGEFVVNKRATAANYGLLKQINSLSSPIGIHRNSVRPMANGGILDGGLSARQQAGGVQESIQAQNQLANAVKSLPNPVVLVEDINTGQNRNVVVKDRANVTK